MFAGASVFREVGREINEIIAKSTFLYQNRQMSATVSFCFRGRLFPEYTEVYSVICDSGSVPDESIFSQSGTLPTLSLSLHSKHRGARPFPDIRGGT